MTATRDEIERREKSARDAIKRAFGTKEDEYGATLFVSHHLDGIEESYWQKHLGTANPEPSRVLDILELRSHWGDEGDGGVASLVGITGGVISGLSKPSQNQWLAP